MTAQSVLIICVNYNRDDETVGFVNKYFEQIGILKKMAIIVDNSESANVAEPLRSLEKIYNNLWLYKPSRNLGYYGGAALGFHEYIKYNSLPNWTIVSNTDIDLIQPDMLSKLCSYYSISQHAVIAPAIYSSITKTDQNPFMSIRPDPARMKFYKFVFRYYITTTAYLLLALVKQKLVTLYSNIAFSSRFNNIEATSHLVPRAIYAPHGSFIVFHRSYFEAGGNLEHDVFLFGEEVFVAETARRLGLTVVYDPRLFVMHREHASTGVLKNRKMFSLLKQSSAYCADKYFSSKGSDARK